MAGSDVVVQAIEVAREIIADVADAAEGMVVLPGGYAIFPTVGEARGPYLCKVTRQARSGWDRARYPAGVYPDYALSGSGTVPPTRTQAAEFLQWEDEIRKAIRG
jgi:hypothetical protein